MPKSLPLRLYPDISHNVRCQYPVPDWDRAFAHTLGREACNPRPLAQAHIFRLYSDFSDGFITYSDGIHDDLNKIVWTALGWDPARRSEEIVQQYGRYFFGPDQGSEVAEGILLLERNWQGPLAGNAQIEKTLAHWQALENRPAALQNNWRFQMHLLRAYYDAFLQRRLQQESQQEIQVRNALLQGRNNDLPSLLRAALADLKAFSPTAEVSQLAVRIEALGAQLWKSIGLQLDVARYGALSRERGAILDFLQRPLNDRPWLEAALKEILATDNHPRQQALLGRLLDWENPGPGGYYDDLGNSRQQSHLAHPKTWEEDPGYLKSPQNEFTRGWNEAGGQALTAKLSWLDQAQTLYQTPLRMRYTSLDSTASYTLRILYRGRFQSKMRLLLTGSGEELQARRSSSPASHAVSAHLPLPTEYAVPKGAIRDGSLHIEWQVLQGRGCQVAEVWLLRSPENPRVGQSR